MITFNGTTIEAVQFNGQPLEKIKFNGTLVWELLPPGADTELTCYVYDEGLYDFSIYKNTSASVYLYVDDTQVYTFTGEGRQTASGINITEGPHTIKLRGGDFYFEGVFVLGDIIQELYIGDNYHGEIEPMTFSEHSNLRFISLGPGVTSISIQNPNLRAINFVEGLESIGNGCFEGSMLMSVSIPDSVKSIGARAFANCTIDSVYFGSGSQLETIEEECFMGSSLISIDLPDTVYSCGSHAFADCVALMSCNLPNIDCQLGYGVWQRCTSLQHIYLGTTITQTTKGLTQANGWVTGVNIACVMHLRSILAEYSSSQLASMFGRYWYKTGEGDLSRVYDL